MPPERFDGRSDARGDVYSLGTTLYELLTLRPVFEEPDRSRLIERVLRTEPTSPRQIDRRVPRDLETVILKAMAKDPARRYATAGQMAGDLQRFLEGRPISARRVGARERVVRWARRQPLIAALCGAVTMLLASLLGHGAWSYLRISRALTEESIARDRADKALEIEARTRADLERRSADLELDRGIGLAEDRQVGRGLLWMLRSQELAPTRRPRACGGPPGPTSRPGSIRPSPRSSSYRPAARSSPWLSAPTAGRPLPATPMAACDVGIWSPAASSVPCTRMKAM